MGITLAGTEVKSSGDLTLAALADSDVIIGEGSNTFIKAFGTEETFSIGSSTSSTKLFVYKSDATNTGITDVIGITHGTSGTPGNGIGTGIGFNVEGAGGSVQGGRIASVLTDVTDDGEDSELRFFAMAGGSLSATSILSLATTGVSGSAIKDEDNMSSDSATHLATQQSIKAYMDSQGLSSANITLSSVANLDILQYNSSSSKWVNRTTAAAGLVTLTGSETVTNKTLTSPVINTPNLTGGTAVALTGLAIRSSGSGTYDVTIRNTENLGAARTLTFTLNDAARTITLGGNLTIAGNLITSGAYATTLTTTGTTGITLPTTGTLATLAGAETFTNKSLDDSTTHLIDNSDATKRINFQVAGLSTSTTRTVSFPDSSGTLVYEDTGAILTSKTISGGSNTLSNIANGSLTNSSITVSDGSNTSPVALGGTLTFAATANETTVAESAGTVTIGLPTNVTIAGNLTVSGTTTTISSTVINVADPLLALATTNNAADAVDIGFYGLHDTSGSQDAYSGLFRDANDSGKWKLFKDLQVVPTTTVNTSGTGYAVGTLVANLEGAVTGNAATATSAATWTTARTLSFTGDVTGSGSVNGSANVATALTIPTNGIRKLMVHEDVISGRTELTSGVATDADFLLLWDATDSVFKKVKPDNLGVSGLAVGGSFKLQYAIGTGFAGATNVEIKGADAATSTLALKEMSAPTNQTGFGLLYASSGNNELYFIDEANNSTQITKAGALAGGGVFKGVKVYLSANTAIGNDSLTTVSAWTEVFDVGGWHPSSGTTERFTFPVAGYYSIQVNQTWAIHNDGYREAVVQYRDNSGSSTSIILTDRILSASSETTSSSNSTTTVYVDDPNDYVYLEVRQTSGAALNLTGAADEMTSISIVRLDVATQVSTGATGSLQFSDGSGGHSADNANLFWDDSNNRLGIGTNAPTTTLQVNGVATFESYLDFNLISAPSDPATEDARLYLKQVDANNNAIAIKLQKAGSIQEVEITSPGAVCGVCGNDSGSRDPIYDFGKNIMTLNLFCGHSYEIEMPQWKRVK